MNKNDKITQMPKRTLSVSNYATPITNQANVANRLGDTFGRQAHDRVWQAEVDEWEKTALDYVNLTYGNHYGTRWITDGDSRTTDSRVNADSGPSDGSVTHARILAPPRYLTDTTDPGAYLDQVSAQHPSPTPLAALVRFVGGRV